MSRFNYTPLVDSSFYRANKTRGIYGLKCPWSGAIRYVGSSGHIEKRYYQHVERVAEDKSGGFKKLCWLMELRRADTKPELVILQEIADSDMQDAERNWIQIYELVGGADLNRNLGSNTLLAARSRRREAKKKAKQTDQTTLIQI